MWAADMGRVALLVGLGLAIGLFDGQPVVAQPDPYPRDFVIVRARIYPSPTAPALDDGVLIV